MRHTRLVMGFAFVATSGVLFGQGAGGSALPPEVEAAIKAQADLLAKQGQPSTGTPAATTATPTIPGATRGAAGAPPTTFLPTRGAAAPRGFATSTAPGGISVVLQSLNENRSSSPSGGSMNLSITMTGPNFGPTAVIREVSITNAVDDKGRSLLGGPGRGGILISSSPSMMMSRLANAARGMIPALNGNASLRAAGRDATSIKVIEGEIEVFAPTDGNGSTIQVKDLMATAGKPIEELSKVGVDVIVLTPVTYPAVQARLGSAGMTPPAFSGMLTFYVKDPQTKLVGYIFSDASGAALQMRGLATRGTPNGGQIGELTFATPPTGEIVGSFFLAVPEAMSNVSFRFENINLP